jgi:hypothetical protein
MKEIAIDLGESLKILTSVGVVEFIALSDVAGYCIIISSSGEVIALYDQQAAAAAGIQFMWADDWRNQTKML